MKARIIISHTRGLAPMMMGNLSDEDSNHLNTSGTARKSSLNIVTSQAEAKEVGRVKLNENVSAVDAFVTSERIAVPRLVSMKDTRNLHPKEKVLEVVRKKIPKHHKMCHWDHRFGVI